MDTIISLFANIFQGFINLFVFVFSPSLWPNPLEMSGIVKIIHYGGSSEFLFVLIDILLVLLVVGLFRRKILWAFVLFVEAVNNTIGRFAAWAVLLMVLQQVMIVALQRIFRVSEISIGPFGFVFTRDLSWYAEELKLYNAILVALCAAYTFVQGGHVRVDLVYGAVSWRAKRVIDMVASLLFVLPFMGVVWLYGWYFMWRHLVTPKVSVTDKLTALERKAKIMKWNVETIGFSPNGFDAYFLFKILLLAFAGLMFIQGVAFFYRNLLMYIEGEAAHSNPEDVEPTLEEIIAAEHAAIGDAPLDADNPSLPKPGPSAA